MAASALLVFGLLAIALVGYFRPRWIPEALKDRLFGPADNEVDREL